MSESTKTEVQEERTEQQSGFLDLLQQIRAGKALKKTDGPPDKSKVGGNPMEDVLSKALEGMTSKLPGKGQESVDEDEDNSEWDDDDEQEPKSTPSTKVTPPQPKPEPPKTPPPKQEKKPESTDRPQVDSPKSENQSVDMAEVMRKRREAMGLDGPKKGSKKDESQPTEDTPSPSVEDRPLPPVPKTPPPMQLKQQIMELNRQLDELGKVPSRDEWAKGQKAKVLKALKALDKQDLDKAKDLVAEVEDAIKLPPPGDLPPSLEDHGKPPVPEGPPPKLLRQKITDLNHQLDELAKVPTRDEWVKPLKLKLAKALKTVEDGELDEAGRLAGEVEDEIKNPPPGDLPPPVPPRDDLLEPLKKKQKELVQQLDTHDKKPGADPNFSDQQAIKLTQIEDAITDGDAGTAQRLVTEVEQSLKNPPVKGEGAPDPAPNDYSGANTANPTLYYQHNKANALNIKVSSSSPGTDWVPLTQFCAYLAAYWLTKKKAKGKLTFSDLGDKDGAANVIVKWGKGGGLGAQVTHAKKALKNGKTEQKKDVTDGARNKTHGLGTTIWYGTNAHVKAAIKVSDDSYRVYDPDTGSSRTMTAEQFAKDAEKASAFVVGERDTDDLTDEPSGQQPQDHVTSPPTDLPPPSPEDLTRLMNQLFGRIKGFKDQDAKFFAAMAKKLSQAQDLRSKGDVHKAKDALDAIGQELDNYKQGPEPELSEKQLEEKKKKDTQRRLEAERDLQAFSLGDVLSPQIKKIIQDHLAKKGPEASVFTDAKIKYLDDLLDRKKIKDEKTRIDIATKICDALDAVRQRRKDLSEAINNNPNFAPPKRTKDKDGFLVDGGETRSKEIQDAVKVAQQYLFDMANHIPEDFHPWLGDRNLRDRLQTLNDSFGLDEKARTDKINDVLAKMKQPDQDGKTPEEKESQAFIDAIGQGSLNPAELTKFYFDGSYRALTPEQQKKVHEATKKIVDRAYEIHDMGGSVSDVEKALAHIPPEFWPDQFIEAMQAWRKTEREMAEVRAEELFKKNAPPTGFEVFGAIMGTTGLLGDLCGLVSADSNLSKGIGQAMAFEHLQGMGLSNNDMLSSTNKNLDVSGLQKAGYSPDQAQGLYDYFHVSGYADGPKIGDENLGKDIRFSIEELKELTKTGGPLNEILKNKEQALQHFKDKPEDLLKIASQLAKVVGKVNSIGAVAKHTGSFASTFCPIISAVGSGLDLAACAMELAKLCKDLKVANKDVALIEETFYTGKSTDKAMVNALINERSARERKKDKKSWETAGKTVTFLGDSVLTGAVGDPSGGALIAGSTLKIIGKTIELGGKILFANIDWAEAKYAMKLLNEAQAGNPIARVEIFKDCGMYAKMYLCVAARDGDPIAKKFLIDKGVTEPDVMSHGMALKILADKLMKKSDQKDERKAPGRAGHMVDALMGGDTRKVTNYVIDKAGEGGSKVVEQVKKLRPGKEYKPGAWKPPVVTEQTFTRKLWDDEKKKAIANGLKDKSTGVGAGIEAVLKEYAAAEKLYNDGKPNDDKKKKERTKAIVKAQEAGEKLMAAIGSYTPRSNHAEEYPEMVEFLAGLRAQAATHVNRMDKWLYDKDKVGAKKIEWNPIQPAAPNEATWTANWKSASEAAMLGSNDCGVGKALKALDKALQSPDLQVTDKPAKKRKARKKVSACYEAVAKALNRADSAFGEFPPFVEYIAATLDLVIRYAQPFNRESMTYVWADSPMTKGDDVKFSEAGWTAAFKSAVKEGFLKNSDPGVGSGLKDWKKLDDELKKLVKDDKPSQAEERCKVRGRMTKKLGEIVKATMKVKASNHDMHNDMIKYLDFIIKTAHTQCAAERETQGKVKFTADATVSETKWAATYTDATRKGAVPTNDSVKSKLSKALTSYDKADKVYSKEKSQKKRLIKARAVVSSLQGVTKAIAQVSVEIGYDHPDMEKYFSDLQENLTKIQTGDNLLNDVYGKVVDDQFPDLNTFHWSHKDWKDIKKKAVDLGLISGQTTCFGKALDKSKEAYDKWDKANPDKKADLRDKAAAELDRVMKLGAVVKKSTKNAKLVAYLGKFEVIAKAWEANLTLDV